VPLTGPTLVCYDGSEGSRNALHSVGPVVAVRDFVVLTVWQPLTTRLESTSGFAVIVPDDEAELDTEEEAAARDAAEDGARRCRDAGFAATARVAESIGPVWETIVAIADEIDSALLVCGTRGRGSVESFLLGSTSRALLRHARRPLLIAPEPPPEIGG